MAKKPVKSLPEYNSWRGMRKRCYAPRARNYDCYGGRGIQVCDRWRESFSAFLEDMGPRPGPGYSLDRINNDGNYEPGNCRWATASMQMRNARTNVIVTIGEKTQSITEWCEDTGVPRNVAFERIRRGWRADVAVTKPVKPCRTVAIGGVSKTVSEWCSVTGVGLNTARARIHHGWNPALAVTEPPMKRVNADGRLVWVRSATGHNTPSPPP